MAHQRLTKEQMIMQYKRRVQTLADGSKLIPLEKGLFDIFTGKEWLTRSRYIYAQNRWIYLTGVRLDAAALKLLPDLAKKARVH